MGWQTELLYRGPGHIVKKLKKAGEGGKIKRVGERVLTLVVVKVNRTVFR